MSVSTNGQIAYGIPFEEGFEFPWDNEPWDGDEEQWWCDAMGYSKPFEPFTPEGEYAPGFARNDPRIDEYYRHKREWLEANPLPIDKMNYCSDRCPMIMLAIPGLGLSCRRGYPEPFDPQALQATPEHRDALLAFCRKWGIETTEEPKWYLTSYWG